MLAYSVPLMLVIAAIGAKVGATLDLRHAIEVHSAGKPSVTYGGNEMDRAEFVRRYVARAQLSEIDYWLLNRRNVVLWGVLYTLAGLSGGVVALWLRLAGIRLPGPEQQGSRLAELLAAAFAGVMTYFLLRLPAPLLGRVFANAEALVGGGDGGYTIYNNSIPLAIVAGIFIATFYTRLASLLRG